ncbi:hypothetical protein ACOSQ4_008050 [Xanthoceras sorbifolium]
MGRKNKIEDDTTGRKIWGSVWLCRSRGLVEVNLHVRFYAVHSEVEIMQQLSGQPGFDIAFCVSILGPDRWVLFHWGELRERMGSWKHIISWAFEIGGAGPYCFESAAWERGVCNCRRMADQSGMKHQGAWWYPLVEKECPSPQKDGQVGHNESFIAEWTTTVLNQV